MVAVIELTPCIEFEGAKNERGYGHVRHQGRVVRAHRLAYVEAHGLRLADIAGQVVRHRCDNPACIRPDHLLLGTHTDNMRDKEERGRGNQPKGERNAKAKLCAGDVRQIRARAASGDTNRQIAGEFGIDPSQVSRINTRRIWGHVA